MILTNERGSALIITMMLLLILTAIGIYAISVSTTEMSIALQSKRGTALLNSADSGANRGFDLIPILVDNTSVFFHGVLPDGTENDMGSWDTTNRTLKPGYGSNLWFPDYAVQSKGYHPQFLAGREVQAVINYGPVPNTTMY